MGFDFNRGRLDLAPHPFCSSIPTDVRITARFAPDDFVDGLMIVLHESGHGRYQQGLPPDWLDQPVGAARSTCLHEGQAILTEMQLGRSRAFLEFLAPLIAKAFPDVSRIRAMRLPAFSDQFGPKFLPGRKRLPYRCHCGTRGYCSPSAACGYRCHTANDVCIDDGDCAALGCNFDTKLGYWTCGGNCGVIPP